MTNKHEWKSVSFIRQSRSLHYGRFMLSSLKEGQANILGTTIRRVLLAEIKGTRIRLVSGINYYTLNGWSYNNETFNFFEEKGEKII
jgi:DNA-directed RNA polymerase alpha subunit